MKARHIIRERPAQQQGFTLIELVVVIAIVAIMASQAGPAFSTLAATIRAKSTASNLHLALLKARSEAVKRNAAVTLQADAAGWQDGWELTDAGGNVLAVGDAQKGMKVTANLTTVIYQPSGRVQGITAPQMQIQDPAAKAKKRYVCVNLGGRPYTKTSACP